MNYDRPKLADEVAALVRRLDRHARAFCRTQDVRAGDGAVRVLQELEAVKAKGGLPLGWHGPEPRMWALPCRDSWLAARRLLGTVGGSDVGPIVYGAYDGLWGFARPDLKGRANTAMSAGHLWEPWILALYCRETGATLEPLPAHTIHLRWGWAHVSADGLARPAEARRSRTVVDAKLVFRIDEADSRESYDLEHHVWGPSGDVDPASHPCDLPLPPYILGQAVLLMAVLDLPTCDIAALLPHYQLRVYTVWRHAERERAVLHLCRKAWVEHRVKGVPPPADQTDICMRWYAEQRQRGERGRRVATENEIELVKQFDEARAARKAAHEREWALRAQLVAAMGSKHRIDVEPNGEKLATIDSRGTVRTYQ